MGVKAEDRRWTVVVVPVGQEDPRKAPEVIFRGPRDRAEEYYELARERHALVPEGAGLALVDGVGRLVYACS